VKRSGRASWARRGDGCVARRAARAISFRSGKHSVLFTRSSLTRTRPSLNTLGVILILIGDRGGGARGKRSKSVTPTVPDSKMTAKFEASDLRESESSNLEMKPGRVREFWQVISKLIAYRTGRKTSERDERTIKVQVPTI